MLKKEYISQKGKDRSGQKGNKDKTESAKKKKFSKIRVPKAHFHGKKKPTLPLTPVVDMDALLSQ